MDNISDFWHRNPGIFASPKSASATLSRPRLTAPEHTLPYGATHTLWAPAGAGKSTLMRRWAGDIADDGDTVAWVSLAESVGELPPLSSLVTSAVFVAERQARRGVDETEGMTLTAAFAEAHSWQITDCQTPTSIIVDDVHRLNNRQDAQWLADLARAHNPSLRILLAGRFSPLSPRLDDGIPLDSELREADLAFTREEVRELFSTLQHPLAEEDLSIIMNRTGGWPLALALLTQILPATDNRQRFFDVLARDQHAVGDFLVTELLSVLPRETTTFLVETSVADRLTLDLAVHLSHRPNAGALLDELEMAHLVERVETPRGTFYNYHAVLKSYLRAHLTRHSHDIAQSQRAQATAWYLTHGWAPEALAHAVSGRDSNALQRVLDDQGFQLVFSGHTSVVEQALLVLTEARTESAMTHTLAVLLAMPSVSTGAVDTFHLARAASLLTDARHSVRIVHAALGVMAACASPSASVRRAEALESLNNLIDTQRPTVPASHADDPALLDAVIFAEGVRGWAAHIAGDRTAACHFIRTATIDARLSHRPWLQLLLLGLSATIEADAANWHEVYALQEQTKAVSAPLGIPATPVLAMARLSCAVVAYERCEPVEPTDIDAILAAAPPRVETGLWGPAEALRLNIELDSTRGQRQAFEQLHNLLQAQGRYYPRTLAACAFRYVDLSLHLAGAAQAREAARLVIECLGADTLDGHLASAVVAAGTTKQRECEDALSAALANGATAAHETTPILCWLLLARWAEDSGRTTVADSRVMQALDIAHPLRSRRAFQSADGMGLRLLATRVGRLGPLDEYARSILTRGRDRHNETGGSLVELGVLTRKEHEILRELPAHQSIMTIAHNQQLSPNTIKTHLRSIYQKLGVTGRAEAVNAALQHGLL